MHDLKEKIMTEGKVYRDMLKVDSFLNHQIDVELFNTMGKEFHHRFAAKNITKILTIEVSGIAIACMTAQYFHVPVVYAKKMQAANLDADTYQSRVDSFTKGIDYTIRVDKQYLHQIDRILIIDDFLSKGNAVLGLKEIIDQAGAELMGVGIVIEKEFLGGGQILREQGIDVQSLAAVRSMEGGKIIFA
ncbi:xanthine phosphoribosyltransferase [Dehalobacter sp. DCM]|uniref:xanthine phosphoribosyltransferase n=1 Tax=Dehalobacter sp. DCM TaxID=2907827 RepID=UPI003081CDDC|nr:xanthine phosphoribosyltransferase [Dehalobacter sp. DCM]